MREAFPYNGNTIIMDFCYDELGRPFSVAYSKNGGSSYTTYFYATNSQGDVEGLFRVLLNEDTGEYEQTWYGKYIYDAWGNVTVTNASGGTASATSLAVRNPLRYRGYYYDSETGFYYLQSRYYDPANHRFINADSPEYSTMSAYSTNDTNLFAYCGNDPVNRTDDGGQFWNFVIGAVVGAVVGAVSTAADAVKEGGWDALSKGKTWAKIGISAATGAVGGIVAASGVGLGVAIAWGAGTAAVESVGHQLVDTGKVNGGKLFVDAAVGAFSGWAGGRGAINGNKYMERQVTRFFSHRKTDGLVKALSFGWKMTKNYSKQFVLPTVWGIAKSVAGGKIVKASIE